MTIQLHRLEGFYWVSRHSGYAAAARNFPYPITQPAVHQQVKKLEDELGCKLFERVAKDRVRHTAAGRKLFEFCAPFFAELPGVVRALRTGEFGGELRIDGVPLAVRRLLPGWIRRLHDQHPDISVALTEVSEPDLSRLRSGEADLVVDTFDVLPPGIERTQVGIAYAFILLPEDHKAASRKKPRPELLAGETFIAYPTETRHHAMQMQGLERIGVTAGQLLVAPSTESILSYVGAGLGYSLIPWLDKEGPEQPGVAARRLKGLGTEFPIHVVHRPGPGASPLVEAALDCAPSVKKRR